MSVYIAKAGKNWGPYESKQVSVLVERGSFADNDWAWIEGEADWMPVSELLEMMTTPVEAQTVHPVEAQTVQPVVKETAVCVAWWRGGLFRKLSVAGLVVLLVVGWGGRETDYSSLQRRDGLAFAPGSDTPFEGRAVSYHPNGQRMYSSDFVDGEENGQIISWYVSGQKQSEAEMKDGKFHGKVTYWHANGRMMGHYTYEHGHVITRKDWDPEGHVYERK